jgi:hypothetical protein
MKEKPIVDYSVPFVLNIVGGIFLGLSFLLFLFPKHWSEFAFLAPESWAGDAKAMCLLGFSILLLSFFFRLLIDIRFKVQNPELED